MRNMRVTDTRFNRRTVLPRERSIEEESMIEVRKNMWVGRFTEYVVEHCNKDGNIKQGTLTEEQMRGLKKLAKRVKDGEIVVTRTDKSGRLFVSRTEDYMEKGMVHVGNDRRITEKEEEFENSR